METEAIRSGFPIVQTRAADRVQLQASSRRSDVERDADLFSRRFEVAIQRPKARADYERARK